MFHDDWLSLELHSAVISSEDGLWIVYSINIIVKDCIPNCNFFFMTVWELP